jgi:hypothetical protein
VFGLAGQALAGQVFGGGFAALGSLFGSSLVPDCSDSEEDTYAPKPRARSEGARAREIVPVPALKKPNSRRNSRGGQPLRVSFSCPGSDDEEDTPIDDQFVTKRTCKQKDETVVTRSEEQEPMGEPEPSSCENLSANTTHEYGWDSLAMSRKERRSITPRRELRMLLDLNGNGDPSSVAGSGAGSGAGNAENRRPALDGVGSTSDKRRARLRGRLQLHGYSICDTAET